MALPEYRQSCARCRRPEGYCYCAELPRLRTRVPLVFLQHPRERRVAVGTARMAHLALENSELHIGVSFADHRRLGALVSAPGARPAVLFPGEGATDVESLPDAPNPLIVVDGTWSQARKLVLRDGLLSKLPRVGFTPSKPGNYRIRKEPALHCLSTIEAVVEVLERLERAPFRYQPMLRAFELMVDRQLACIARSSGSRHKLKRPRRTRRHVAPELASSFDRLVVLYAEANAHPQSAGTPPELVHWVATRPGRNEKFEALVRPRRALSPSTPFHLELPAARFTEAEPLGDAKRRFEDFLQGAELVAGWGHFARKLLASEEIRLPPSFVDLRLATTRHLKERAGGIEQAAALLGIGEVSHWSEGRAGRRIGLLDGVARQLASLPVGPGV